MSTTNYCKNWIIKEQLFSSKQLIWNVICFTSWHNQFRPVKQIIYQMYKVYCLSEKNNIMNLAGFRLDKHQVQAFPVILFDMTMLNGLHHENFSKEASKFLKKKINCYSLIIPCEFWLFSFASLFSFTISANHSFKTFIV